MNNDDWQAWQHQDELVRQQRVDEILRAAEYRALNVDEIQILASEAGMQQHFHKPT